MSMIRVGITGQSGFIGTHLYNTLGLFQDRFRRIAFEDSFFTDTKKLAEFVSDCDVLVHLAALNRHNDPGVIYETNIDLVKKLLVACETGSVKPHIIFSSSTQEEKDNLYGRSKKEGRELFENWANENSSNFTGFVIPNVFGPFGNPYYNSVVATFCHQLTHKETPRIEVDGELNLIYVGELVSEIIRMIELKSNYETSSNSVEKLQLSHSHTIKVSELLNKLSNFRDGYFENGIIPNIEKSFELNLFNTFLSYIDHQTFYPFSLKSNSDNRGSFVETIKLNSGGQVSFSTTNSGITRGNHFHTRKAERFAVIKGNARIELRRIGTNEKLSFELDGEKPSFVDMPVWYTHNIINIGKEELYTIFWINEFFDPTDPDTYFEKV
jgi:UDP-2-acetamido-2,6-beta-L-arabino-hexul-4-ose reductase